MPVYNFAAGPAKLPKVVLEEARDQMMSFNGCGMSVMGTFMPAVGGRAGRLDVKRVKRAHPHRARA